MMKKHLLLCVCLTTIISITAYFTPDHAYDGDSSNIDLLARPNQSRAQLFPRALTFQYLKKGMFRQGPSKRLRHLQISSGLRRSLVQDPFGDIDNPLLRKRGNSLSRVREPVKNIENDLEMAIPNPTSTTHHGKSQHALQQQSKSVDCKTKQECSKLCAAIRKDPTPIATLTSIVGSICTACGAILLKNWPSLAGAAINVACSAYTGCYQLCQNIRDPKSTAECLKNLELQMQDMKTQHGSDANALKLQNGEILKELEAQGKISKDLRLWKLYVDEKEYIQKKFDYDEEACKIQNRLTENYETEMERLKASRKSSNDYVQSTHNDDIEALRSGKQINFEQREKRVQEKWNILNERLKGARGYRKQR